MKEEILKDIIENDEVYDSLKEIAYNCLKGKIPLKRGEMIKLRRIVKGFKNLLANKNKRKRRKLTNQIGSGIWYLIPIVYEILRNVIK